MRQGFDRSVVVGIAVLFLMIVGIGATSLINTRQMRFEADRVVQSQRVIDAVESVHIDTRRLQAEQRGYLITGFDDWLEPYRAAAQRLRESAAHVAQLTADDPEQHARAVAAQREVESGIAKLDAVVKRRGEPGGYEAVIALSRERGRRSYVDPFLAILAEMEEAERGRLAAREVFATEAYRTSVFSGAVVALLGLAAVSMFVWVLQRENLASALASARLADQRELLAATLKSIGDAVITTDDAGRVTFLNQVAENLTKWPLADAEGKPLDEVFHIVNESTRQVVESPALKALKEGLIIGLANHTILIAKDGSERPIDDSAAPIRSEGRISGAVLVFRDISEKKRAEAEKHRLLLEVETERTRLAEVFQNAPSFLCVLRGPTHVFERANDHYRQLVGGRDLLGKPVREALPEVEGQGFFEILDRVLATGEPFVGTGQRVTLLRGENLEERFLDFVYQPLREADGTVTGIVAQGIDLTERKRAEHALARVTAESERLKRMYDTALSHTADFVYLFDLQGRFTYVNKALLDLWKKELPEAVGKNFHELDYPAELASRLQRQIQQVIDTRQPLRDETPYTSDLGTRAYEYIFVPVFDAGGEVEAVAGSTREITERKQSEDRLSASEERYRILVTANSDVVYRMSADWSELYPLNGRDLVASNAEPIRDWLEKNLPSFEHARVREAIHRAISTKQAFEMEHQVIGVDGTLGWTLSRAAPILDSAGNIVEWFGTARDVTAQKQTESDLRDIRSRMEAALSAGAIGTWAWDVPNDRFFADASLAAIFSMAPEDVAGASLSSVVHAIHPEDRERVAALIDAAVTSGNWYEADYRVAQKDGGWKWVTARGRVERDAQGRAVRFPGVVIDVTDRKLAEEALARMTALSEQRKRLYETALSNTPDLVYVFDRNHRFIYANEALLAMWAKTWDEAIGKTCLELGYELWHASMHDREIEQVVSTRKPIRGVVPFTGSKGRRDYDYIFVPVLGANGEVGAVAGTTRDITDQKAASEALRESDRKKDDFIALLAHELRNPLAPIRNGLQVIRLSSEPSIRDQVQQMMDRQLSHMVRMIDDLLDVSRIGRHKMELRRERVLLSDVINSAVETARPAIEEAGHELSVELPQNPVSLDADLTRLSQVFSNLLVNSAKYTERGGRIWLTAQENQDEISVSVRDTGIGIPPESLSAIFDMFSQIERPLERKTGGLGIGLALVKGLVEIHGGSVTAYSQGLGTGSTFTVTLPRLVEPNDHARTSDMNHGRLPSAPKRKVLVVDDNHDGAQSLAMMLKLTGNDVAMAHDGLEAVEQAERFRPDCILMDMGMPKLNGLEAARRIREMAWGRSIVIIALTGWGQETDRELTRQAGCDGHLVKPVSLDDLQTKLNELGSRERG